MGETVNNWLMAEFDVDIPGEFARVTIEVYGAPDAKWVRKLPDLLEDVASNLT